VPESVARQLAKAGRRLAHEGLKANAKYAAEHAAEYVEAYDDAF
jgi:hypothetical protein